MKLTWAAATDDNTARERGDREHRSHDGGTDAASAVRHRPPPSC
ncbi:hypothetical protein [Streptomyces hydrogenans]